MDPPRAPQPEGEAETPGGPGRGGDRQPQYSGGLLMIPPDETRRSEMNRVAQRGQETLQRLRDENRVRYVSEAPETLGGGAASMEEVRRRQQAELRCSKVQKKVEQEDMRRRRREAEEEELQKMKDEQRNKAERQEQRRREEEQRRREELRQDHLRRNERFLQSCERAPPNPPPPSSTGEAVDSSGRDVQQDQRRVNSAFLDRLQGLAVGSEGEGPGARQASTGQPPAHLKPDPGQSRTQEADPDPDLNWALMKLVHMFPGCSRVVLEDILQQCHGDFEEALVLLSCTFT